MVLSRVYFTQTTESDTQVDILKTVIPLREGYVIGLKAYMVEALARPITYSTTATWRIDAILTTERRDPGDWDLVAITPASRIPAEPTIDSWRFDGGSGRIVTQGGYLIYAVDHQPAIYTDLLVPALFVVGRRISGLNQSYSLKGWIDFEWVKASPATIAAVHLAWGSKGLPQS